jgi:hypothetical protein
LDTKATSSKENCGWENQIHMRTIVKLQAGPSGFTDDKDEAKRIRIGTILPALESNKQIVLDFIEVKSSTQSFVHALLGEVLQRFREGALNKLEFRNCSPLMKSLIELVVDYSLGGFQKTDGQQPKQRRNTATKR